MTEILLSIIAGLIAVDVYFKLVVNSDGTTDSSTTFTMLGMVVLVSAVLYGASYVLSSFL